MQVQAKLFVIAIAFLLILSAVARPPRPKSKQEQKEERHKRLKEEVAKLEKKKQASKGANTPSFTAPKTEAPPAYGVDFGTAWQKVVIVDPSSSAQAIYDMALSEQSNRKTPNVVGFDRYNGDQLLTGEAGKNLADRAPDRAFLMLKRLLGQSFSSPLAQAFRIDFPQYKLQENPSHSIDFIVESLQDSKDQGSTSISVEELVTLLLRQTQTLTQNTPRIGDEVVFAVPPYWTQSRRDLFSQLAELAGLKVLKVISDLTAVAIDYATGRAFTNPEKIIFLDIGSHATSASLVEFSQIGNEKILIKVLGTATEHQVSGFHFDKIIAQYLEEQFNAKLAKAKRSERLQDASFKAKWKLLQEAQFAKEILSAGGSYELQIENLAFDTGLSAVLTKGELEQLLNEKILRVPQLVEQVIAKSGVNEEEVTGIELFGGGVRVPNVQQTLQSRFETIPLRQQVNGEESAAFGAGIYAGQLKNWRLHPLGVEVEENVQETTEEERGKMSIEEAEQIKKNVEKADQREKERAEAAERRNTLESFLFSTKSETEADKTLTTEQKQRIRDAIGKTLLWMEDESESASVSEFDQVLEAVQAELQAARAKKNTKLKEEL